MEDSNIKKRNKTIIIFIISMIIIILVATLYVSKPQYYSPVSPIVNCEIVFHNDTSNMIRWIVTQTGGDTINQNDLRLVLENSSNGNLVIEPNIIYHDKDNSDSITVGDIFEVYAPDNGYYAFGIIDNRVSSLACSYNEKY
jgi:hypothetical protein